MSFPQRKNRQTIIRAHFNVFAARMLEFGALDYPTFARDQVSIQFLDWFTSEELREKYPHRRVDDIPHVDFAVKAKRFAAHVDARFDLLIGNHVFEHVPDPLTWVTQAESLLNPGGAIFMSIPDNRYTFDMIRQLTDYPELLRCHDADLERPDLYQLFRAFYYYRPIRSQDAWSGDVEERLKRARYSVPKAMELAVDAAKTYTDVHCHVFTAAAFPALWSDIVSAGFSTLSLSFIDDVQENDNEFHVILSKDGWESTPTDPKERSVKRFGLQRLNRDQET